MKKETVTRKFASVKMLQVRGLLMLGLLIAQFVVGMTTAMYTHLPDSHPGTTGNYFSSSWAGYHWSITNGGGISLTLHVVIATVLVLGSIATLGFSIAAKHKAWIIAATIGLIGVWMAFLNGLEFINANVDKHSLAMAFSFMIAFVAYGAGLFFAKE